MNPHIPQNAPYVMQVIAGDSYYWCFLRRQSKQALKLFSYVNKLH